MTLIATKELSNSSQQQTRIKSIVPRCHTEIILTSIRDRMKLRRMYTRFCNKHNTNISFICVDRYSRNALELKSRNNVELARALVAILQISDNNKYWNYSGQ
jgi:hypothetical protein